MKRLFVLILTLSLFSSVYAVERVSQTQQQKVDIHQQWQTLHQQVVMLYEQGVYGEAIEHAIKSLQFARENIGENHLDVARTQTNLALLTNHHGRFDEAEFLYKRALTTVEKSLGLFHVDVAIILENLSLLYKDTSREQLSNKLHQRVLEIRVIQEKNKKEIL